MARGKGEQGLSGGGTKQKRFCIETKSIYMNQYQTQLKDIEII